MWHSCENCVKWLISIWIIGKPYIRWLISLILGAVACMSWSEVWEIFSTIKNWSGESLLFYRNTWSCVPSGGFSARKKIIVFVENLKGAICCFLIFAVNIQVLAFYPMCIICAIVDSNDIGVPSMDVMLVNY